MSDKVIKVVAGEKVNAVFRRYCFYWFSLSLTLAEEESKARLEFPDFSEALREARASRQELDLMTLEQFCPEEEEGTEGGKVKCSEQSSRRFASI